MMIQNNINITYDYSIVSLFRMICIVLASIIVIGLVYCYYYDEHDGAYNAAADTYNYHDKHHS